ncbi:TonB family protein [Desulfobacula sp.]
MNRFIVSAIIAILFHIGALAFLPSFLKKNETIVPPKIKQVLVTLSHRQPVIKKTAFTPPEKKEPPVTKQIKKIKPLPKPIIKPKPVTEPNPIEKMKPAAVAEPLVRPKPAIRLKDTLSFLPQKKPNDLLQRKDLTRFKNVVQNKPVLNNQLKILKKELNQVIVAEAGLIKTIEKKEDYEQTLTPKKIKPQKKEIIKPEQALIEFARPLYKKNPLPAYPSIAKKRGYQGIVELKVLVSKKGIVTAIKIFKSSKHKSLDQKAVATVKKWLFEPGKKNGVAQKMWVKIPVRFELK